MKTLLSRASSLFFLFLLAFSFVLFLLWGMPNKDTWSLLWTHTFSEMAIGFWIIILTWFLSIAISTWSLASTRAREQAFQKALRSFIEGEGPSNTRALSLPVQKTLQQVEDLVLTQKKSLLRLTNERAEAENKIIQERIVQERQRLARELHDSVSQQLFAASMLLSALSESQEEMPDSTFSLLQQTEKMVQQAQLEMRALLLHLRPAALHNKSLAQGLQELIEELQQKVFFTIHFRLEDVPLTKGAEDHLFRIAQETLSNTLRHSKASEVDVLLIARDGLAIFRLQDNGVGFHTNESNSVSYGLQNIEERAIEVGGTCKIVSVPNQGTIVEVKIPIAKGVDPNDTNHTS